MPDVEPCEKVPARGLPPLRGEAGQLLLLRCHDRSLHEPRPEIVDRGRLAERKAQLSPLPFDAARSLAVTR